jgi:hypothetical protein
MSENHDHDYVESSERLNAYIEALLAEATTVNAGPQNEADARLWQTARLLKVAAHPEKAAVRSEFAADLEKRLLVQQRLLAPPKPAKSWWPDWLTSRPISWSRRWAVAAVAMLLLAFLAVPLIEQWQRPLPPLPALGQVVQAYWGLEGLPPQPAQLGDVSFELTAPLPAAPASLTVYRQEANPVRLADVEAMARRLGIAGQVHPVGESFVVDDGQQRLLISQMQKGYYYYQLLHPPVSSNQAPIQADRAAEQAQTFLQEYGLLDFTPAPPQVLPVDENDGRYHLFFPQTVDGLVVENAGITVILSESGQVLEVAGRTILPAAIGRYPILSAAAAYDALQNRDAGRIFLVDLRHGQAGVVVHTVVIEEESEQSVPPIIYQPGDTIELEGLLRATIFTDNDGNPGWVNAFLIEDTSGYAFRLLGPRLGDLAQYDQFHVRSWGRVVLDDRGQPALLVDDYRRSRPEEQFVTLLGQLVIVERDGQEQLLFLADDGELYLLPWSQEPQAMDEYRPLADLGQRILLSGTLTGNPTTEGYSVLITARLEIGSEIDELQSAVERPGQRPPVVEDALFTLSGQARIEEIALTYFTLSLPTAQMNSHSSDESVLYLLPAYRFVGQTNDGTSFKVYLQASK